jgi:diguanylate cyclase (GGDEF)-like protein
MTRPALLRSHPAVLLVLLLFCAAAQADRTSFVEGLEQAEALNTTAPWRDTQAVLDRIRPELEQVDEPLQARFFYVDARITALSGDFLRGLQTVRRALELEMSVAHRIHLLRLGANLGVIAREYEQSFGMLSEALELLGREDTPREDYGVYSLASYIYTRVGELDAGIRYGQRAVEDARAYSNARDLCGAEQRLGYAYKIAEDFGSAEQAYRNAIRHCLEANDKLVAGVAEIGLADLYRANGRFDGVEDLFRQGLERLHEVDYPSGLAEGWLYLARLKAGRGAHDELDELLAPAMEQFRREQNWDYLAEAQMLLAQGDRIAGRLDAALDHYDQHINARERFLDSERARRLAFLEVEFDLRHKEQQLALLAEQARVSELQAETRRQQARLTAVGTALALVLVFIMALLLIHATRERRRFQNLSRRDGLTGVLNHTHFFREAERELERCREASESFSLVLADIDHFKQVNDRFGHVAGDAVLRMAASRMRDWLGDRGLVGRIGGEEFAIAMPRIRPAELVEQLDTLCASLRLIRSGDTEIPVTMSFGIADAVSESGSLAGCRERADAALYRAKNEGRNRIVCADD